MANKPGIFPTFFISGFECSSFLWKDKGRRNLIAETQHDRFAMQDYTMLRKLGIAVSREGIPWPLVDKNGVFDFSIIDPMIEAMKQNKIVGIWDLCHYGYPDDLDPYSDTFSERFKSYCKAAVKYISEKMNGPYYFTPINEITFFSFAAAEWGWIAPFGKSKDERLRFRLALCKAAIAGVKGIREIEPDARMIHIDPLVQVVAPYNRPDQAEAAWHETYVDTFFAWDVICGKIHPELGGSPEILDIVGANNYSFGQMEYREHGPHAALAAEDERIKPLCDLLRIVHERYQRPLIIGETSGMNEGRVDWLRDVMEESLAAVNSGINLHGICIFPAVDMPDWHTGAWLHNGICDIQLEDGVMKRIECVSYVDELRRWQKELNRITELDEDPFSDPVELQDVIDAAKRLNKQPDKNWN